MSTTFFGPPFLPFVPPSAPLSGGALLGQALADPQGVCVAFDDDTLVESPQWHRLDDPAGPFKVTGWEIRRGRSYELDKTVGGTARVTLVDQAGNFDPTWSSGPLFGKLEPMKQAAIALQNPVTSAWTTLFRGFVSDWDFEMDITERLMYVTLTLVDGFDLLAAAELLPGLAGITPPSISTGDVYYPHDQAVDARIHAILNDAGWPLGLREIFSGNVTCQETVYANRTPALSAMFDAADAEWPGVANIYMGKTGKVVFHGRYARFRPAVVEYDIDTFNVGDAAQVTANPTTYAPVREFGFTRGKTNLINEALAAPQNMADADLAGQYSSDAASIAAHGSRSVSFGDLLTYRALDGSGRTAAQETKLYSNYFPANYADPRTRIRNVSFKTLPVGVAGATTLWNLMCGIEISDILHVVTTHPWGGGFSEDFYVEGLSYSARPMSDTLHEVELEVEVSPKAYYTVEPA